MTIDTKQFIILYREAFGENAPLPIVFYYSNEAAATPVKTGGCMFKQIVKAKEGENIALDSETVTCGGGRHYAGFAPLPEYVYTFVSEKERYKATPQDVADCMRQFDIRLTDKKYLNFVRVDKATDWKGIEGLLFFATPDMLSGLATWAYFDNNAEDAVSAIFGAGCTTVISHAVRENRRGGRRSRHRLDGNRLNGDGFGDVSHGKLLEGSWGDRQSGLPGTVCERKGEKRPDQTAMTSDSFALTAWSILAIAASVAF